MGTFRFEITAVGGHGQDRSKKDGEKVDFKEGGEYTPEALVLRFINDLKHFGMVPKEAKIIHWPGEPAEVEDNLLTGIRKGKF
jgi:hypothetical protein